MIHNIFYEQMTNFIRSKNKNLNFNKSNAFLDDKSHINNFDINKASSSISNISDNSDSDQYNMEWLKRSIVDDQENEEIDESKLSNLQLERDLNISKDSLVASEDLNRSKQSQHLVQNNQNSIMETCESIKQYNTSIMNGNHTKDTPFDTKHHNNNNNNQNHDIPARFLYNNQPESYLNYIDTKNFESDEYSMIEELKKSQRYSFYNQNGNNQCNTMFEQELQRLNIPLTVIMFILKQNSLAKYIQSIIYRCNKCRIFKCRNSRLPKTHHLCSCDFMTQCFTSCQSNNFLQIRTKEILIESCPTHLVILQSLSILKPIYSFQSIHSNVKYLCYIYNCSEGSWTRKVEKILMKDGSFILKNFKEYAKKKFA